MTYSRDLIILFFTKKSACTVRKITLTFQREYSLGYTGKIECTGEQDLLANMVVASHTCIFWEQPSISGTCVVRNSNGAIAHRAESNITDKLPWTSPGSFIKTAPPTTK